MKTTLLRWILLWNLCLLCCASVSSAQDAKFFIGEGGQISWADALQAGKITPASNPLSGFAAQQFYASQIGQMGVTDVLPATGVRLTATGPLTVGNETHDSMVMSWEASAAQTNLDVAAWDFHYGVDPDLTNSMIHFSIFPPPGVWDVSLELFDINGNSRGWFVGNPPGGWGTFWIDPNGGLQAPFGVYINQAGFDITQVTTIRLNESSMGGTAFTLVDPTTGLPNPWNAWNHLRVTQVPEPGAWAALGACALSLMRLTLRHRRKAV
jgi:hypothetical protein